MLLLHLARLVSYTMSNQAVHASDAREPIEKLLRGPLRDRFVAVKGITEVFWIERFVYLTIVATGIIILLAAAIVSLVKGKTDDVSKFIMGGSGVTVFGGASLLLYMWNKSLNIVMTDLNKSRETGE